MKSLLAATALLGLLRGCANVQKPAEEESAPPKKESPAVLLKVGDLAPPLQTTKWLQGKEVKTFEPGKLYVVEFWASWCGPCIASMPHSAELQTEYKDRGLTFICFSARDPNNSEEQVASFVKKRGPKLPLTFAYGDSSTMYDAWVTASGHHAIPCAFLVDKTGRIAYIGHPIFLGAVIPKALENNATPESVSAAGQKIEEDSRNVSAAFASDPKAGLKALAELEANYPSLANIFPWVRSKLSYLPKYGEPGEAKRYAEAMVAKATATGDISGLRMVSSILRLGDGKDSKELLDVGVQAAAAELHLAGDKDARALINLAGAYFAAGDKAKAKEYAQKAVQAAAVEPASTKQFVESEAKKISGDAH